MLAESMGEGRAGDRRFPDQGAIGRRFIKIGRISGASGLRGEVKLYHDSGDAGQLRRLDALALSGAAGADIQGCAPSDHGQERTAATGADALPKGAALYRIDALRFQKRTPIMKLSGVDDRSAAEALVGALAWADMDALRPTEEGAFLVSDIVGLAVVESGAGRTGGAPGGKADTACPNNSTEDAAHSAPVDKADTACPDVRPGGDAFGAGAPPRPIGRVVSVVDNPAHDLLEIELSGGRRVLLPMVDAFVHAVDTERGVVEVSMPEGL